MWVGWAPVGGSEDADAAEEGEEAEVHQQEDRQDEQEERSVLKQRNTGVWNCWNCIMITHYPRPILCNLIRKEKKCLFYLSLFRLFGSGEGEENKWSSYWLFTHDWIRRMKKWSSCWLFRRDWIRRRKKWSSCWLFRSDWIRRRRGGGGGRNDFKKSNTYSSIEYQGTVSNRLTHRNITSIGICVLSHVT